MMSSYSLSSSIVCIYSITFQNILLYSEIIAIEQKLSLKFIGNIRFKVPYSLQPITKCSQTMSVYVRKSTVQTTKHYYNDRFYIIKHQFWGQFSLFGKPIYNLAEKSKLNDLKKKNCSSDFDKISVKNSPWGLLRFSCQSVPAKNVTFTCFI